MECICEWQHGNFRSVCLQRENWRVQFLENFTGVKCWDMFRWTYADGSDEFHKLDSNNEFDLSLFSKQLRNKASRSFVAGDVMAWWPGYGRTAPGGSPGDRFPTWNYWPVWGKGSDIYLNQVSEISTASKKCQVLSIWKIKITIYNPAI